MVDDAIVVVEAVQHNIDHEKMSPKEATQKAMKEISGPVIAIALILAAVFIPVGFIPGIVGRLYQQFAITIAVSVLISAFVALSLTPALCTLMLRPSKGENEKRNLLERFFCFIQQMVRPCNEWLCKRSGIVDKKNAMGNRYADRFICRVVFIVPE